MGSWAAFYVEGRDEAATAEACTEWLSDHRSAWARLTKKAVRQTAVSDLDLANNWTLLGAAKKPRRVAVYRQSPRWVTTFYGSFCAPNELAEHVSRRLECVVVDTQGQTTSDAYLVTVLDRGACKRELEFAADVGWIKNDGGALDGEPVPLETEPEDEPGEGWFDHKAVTRYLQSVFDIAWWELPDSTGAILVG